MKKLLFLIFPLAFFVGFLPFFFEDESANYTSAQPDIVEEKEINEDVNLNGIEEDKAYEVELLDLKLQIISNTAVLKNDNITSV